VVLQPGVEMAVLAVAETADGIFIGFVRPALRQFDAPRLEETSDPVQARFAVDVFAIVAIDIEGFESLATLVRPRLEEVVEQALPGGRMGLRGLRHHAVHVEEHSHDGRRLDSRIGCPPIRAMAAHAMAFLFLCETCLQRRNGALVPCAPRAHEMHRRAVLPEPSPEAVVSE
jgi:hypothetical protein